MDERPGELILAVAVLSILCTAPLGAFLMSMVGDRVLDKSPVLQVKAGTDRKTSTDSPHDTLGGMNVDGCAIG